VSGTSAGAINAAIVASALARGDAALARKRLRAFWHGVSQPAVSDLTQHCGDRSSVTGATRSAVAAAALTPSRRLAA
jgi:predicted acylesterase/phospholipase RssA